MADVLEEPVPGVLALVGVNDPVDAQVPHFDVAISGASEEQGLVNVHRHALDSVFMGLVNYSLVWSICSNKVNVQGFHT